MGRRSISGGVMPVRGNRIMFDFRIDGVRFRPTLPWVPHEANLRRARERLMQIKARIAAGTFSFAEEFPDYRVRDKLRVPLRTLTCSEVFDAFLRHDEARVARGDLSPGTLDAHRQILDHVWRPKIGRLPFLSVRHSTLVKVADAQHWSKKTYNNAVSGLRRAFEFGYRDHPEQRDPAAALKSARIRRRDRPVIDPFTIQEAERLIAALHRDWGEVQGNYDEFRFFTGLRPSEQIALVVTDYDATHGTLSVTKARVAGLDKDVTKTGEDRRIVLCPRAVAILERQLQVRARLPRYGYIRHEHLFFDTSGVPFPDLRNPYARWRSTLRRLPIRYRKPYVARHSSVSWDLMIGRNPLWVAQQHGHSLMTMLRVYAAWTVSALESDVMAIRQAMLWVHGGPPRPRTDARPRAPRQAGLGCELVTATLRARGKCSKTRGKRVAERVESDFCLLSH
jgi:integrase